MNNITSRRTMPFQSLLLVWESKRTDMKIEWTWFIKFTPQTWTQGKTRILHISILTCGALYIVVIFSTTKISINLLSSIETNISNN